MLGTLIDIYILLIIVDAVISFVPNPDIQRHPVVIQLRKITELPQRPIRQLLPPDMPFDPSPLVVVLLLRMLAEIV